MARIMSLNYSRQGKPRRLWRLAVATQPTIAENWYKVTYYRCVSIPSGRVFKIRNFFCTIFDPINVITH